MLGTRPNLFTFVFVAVFFVTGVILISGSEALSQSAATVVAIANMRVGATPVDFKFARTGQGDLGQCTVVHDETSFGGCAIEQSSTDRTDYRFPLADL